MSMPSHVATTIRTVTVAAMGVVILSLQFSTLSADNFHAAAAGLFLATMMIAVEITLCLRQQKCEDREPTQLGATQIGPTVTAVKINPEDEGVNEVPQAEPVVLPPTVVAEAAADPQEIEIPDYSSLPTDYADRNHNRSKKPKKGGLGCCASSQTAEYGEREFPRTLPSWPSAPQMFAGSRKPLTAVLAGLQRGRTRRCFTGPPLPCLPGSISID